MLTLFLELFIKTLAITLGITSGLFMIFLALVILGLIISVFKN